MRGWLISCALLVAALALVLWRVQAAGPSVAPSAAEPSARAPHGTPELAPIDPPSPAAEPQARTAAQEAAQSAAERPTARPLTRSDDPPTHLFLRVVQPDGAPWPNGRLLLEEVYDSEVAATDRSRNAGMTRPATVHFRSRIDSLGSVGRVTTQTDWQTDGEGRAELLFIQPGLAFEVRALDEIGGVGGIYEGTPLDAGEVREAVLRLERRAWPVVGRCVDELGTPLDHVRLTITSGESSFGRVGDSEGRFELPPLFAESVTVIGRRRGFIRLERELALPGGPFELVFERARRLVVTLVDPDGVPYTLHELRAYGPPDDARIDTYPEVRDGVHSFDSMPRVPLTLAIEGCGGRPTLEVDASTDAVHWTLPRPGVARFEWAPTTPELGWRIRFDLQRLDGPAAEPVESRDIPRGQPIPEWKLFPGRYRIQALTNDRDNAPAEMHPIGWPREFEVRPGEVVPVTLGD